MQDLKLGMKVYREVKHRNQTTTIRECEITKIGRTYFYLDNDEKTAINISTFFHTDKNYNQFNFQVYRTIKEINDKREQSELYSKVIKFFNGYNSRFIELDKLQEIAKILNIE